MTMTRLLSVDEALARVLAGAAPLPAEEVAIGMSDGRVLAADVSARRTQPPAALSAMDGYAVRAADLPGTLAVIGESAAGRPFVGRLRAGEAARIFTGAVMPDGADAVVIQEDAVRAGDRVSIVAAAPVGRHVRRKGLDFTEGAPGLAAGLRMTPRAIALAAAMNHATVRAHRRPRVAILSTGDELAPPGGDLRPGQIVSSNAFMLAAQAAREGADVHDLGVCPDQLDATVAAIRRAVALKADVLVTSGGASVGEHDLVQKALAHEGAEMGFWKIAMRPGKPLMLGDVGAMRVLGLPGNPVSSFVCAEIFLKPLLRRLASRSDIEPEWREAVLGCDLPANDQRAEYMRASLAQDGGALVATPFALQDSSLLSVLQAADALVLREAHAPAARTGDPCRVLAL